MNIYHVHYEVRELGAIGVFWLMSDNIQANSQHEAYDNFRAKWQHKFEFRFVYHCSLQHI